MMNPERAFSHKHEQKEKPLTPDEDLVWKEYVSSWRESEPDLDSFKSIYSDIEIQRAKKFVRERKTEEKDKHQRAQLFEALLFDALEQELWLGGNAYIARTSEFDDRVNGADLVIEFCRKDADPVRLAVDVTVTANEATLRYKTQQIKEKLERGQLTALKYFESVLTPEEGGVKGSVQDLPQVIIGVSPESIPHLVKPFADRIDGDRDTKKEASRQIEQHPLQLEIIKEIQEQLRVQKEAVSSLVPESSQESVIKAIKEVLEQINMVAEQKEKALPERNALREDRAMRFLTSELTGPYGLDDVEGSSSGSRPERPTVPRA